MQGERYILKFKIKKNNKREIYEGKQDILYDYVTNLRFFKIWVQISLFFYLHGNSNVNTIG